MDTPLFDPWEYGAAKRTRAMSCGGVLANPSWFEELMVYESDDGAIPPLTFVVGGPGKPIKHNVIVSNFNLQGSISEETRTDKQKLDPDNKIHQYYRATVTAQLHLAVGGNSKTLKWNRDGILKGIKYQNGHLTIVTEGLYYVYCHLHFVIKNCLEEEEDLKTGLNVNGKMVHTVLHTLIKEHNCSTNYKIFRDQHFSLQIELNVSDNISIQTSHAHWINKDQLTDNNLFGAFMLYENFK
ncbi:tumor necrosis factor ligand superfamily member 8 [Spea bombifrons]|uniref:tumor necrosis factor ligand superfamily member 8 n=1 Tax=Spea bombifrons TaxID=233779 RepID=UPI00234B7EBE|nr:tumor necrosis factor ligand superfamily member 8 [Spea bombifrons]